MSMPGKSPPPPKLLTVDEYLEFERSAGCRHEYYDGELIALASESAEHGDICTNVSGLLERELKDKPCHVKAKSMKVRSAAAFHTGKTTMGLYAYPDVVVVCGEAEYHDAHMDVVLNPTAIAEVLSPSTQDRDRHKKYSRYRTWNLSLKDYVLIAQDLARVEVFSRDGDGDWSYCIFEGLDAVAIVPSLGCSLNLRDIYDRVDFSFDATDHVEGRETQLF